MTEARLIHKTDVVLAIVAVCGLLAFYSLLTWHTEASEFLSDSSVYLTLAAGWSPWLSFPEAVSEFARARYPYPPLYPAVLALLGSSLDQVQGALLVNAACVAVSALLLFWLGRQQGLSRLLAWGAALLAALLPAAIGLINYVASEFVYEVWSLAALCGLVRFQQRQQPAGLYVACLLVALAWLTRGIGITLFPVVGIVLWQSRCTLSQWGIALGLVLLPQLVWLVLRGEGQGPSYFSTFVTLYQKHGGMAFVLTYLSASIQVLQQAWVTAFDKLALAPSQLVLGMAMVALVLAGVVKLMTAWAVIGWYLAMYLGVILLWPFPDHAQRFLVPILGLLLIALLSGWQWLTGRVSAAFRHWLNPVPLMLCLLLTWPTWWQILDRFSSHPPAGLEELRYSARWLFSRESQTEQLIRQETLARQVREVMAASRDWIPAEECVVASHAELVMYLAQRRAFRPTAATNPDAEFEALLHQCPYVLVVSAFGPKGLSEPLYPIQRLDSRSRLVHQWFNPEGELLGALFHFQPESVKPQ